MKLIAALLASLLLTGCGGGGGSSAPLVPADAALARTTSWRAAQVAENVSAVMSHYSPSFVGPDDGTLAGVQESFEALAAQFDILRVDVVSQTYTTSPSGQLVIAQLSLQYTLRERASGDQGVISMNGNLEWGREGDTWKILRSELATAP
jgi:ketosteroid isomerase-like protein